MDEVDPFRHKNPSAHGPEQDAFVSPNTLPYTPYGHGVGVGDPSPQYDPLVHGRQACDEFWLNSVLKEPAEQFTYHVVPNGQYWPAGHGRQPPTDVAP